MLHNRGHSPVERPAPMTSFRAIPGEVPGMVIVCAVHPNITSPTHAKCGGEWCISCLFL